MSGVGSEPAAKRAKSSPVGEDLSNGRPRYKPDSREFNTGGGVKVKRTVQDLPDSGEAEALLNELVDKLDSRRGCIFESAYEYPGRYARWSMGFVDPPLVLESWGLRFKLSALNARGKVLVSAFGKAFSKCTEIDQTTVKTSEDAIEAHVVSNAGKRFNEEDRSKQPSVFSVVRSVIALWSTDEDPQLGLYGSFGYDLTFQFEPIELKHERDPNQRDMLLYLPDSIVVFDKQMNSGWKIDYEFEVDGASTEGLPREGASDPFKGNPAPKVRRDHEPGEFAKSVEKAREEFKVGNLFECVLSQTFFEPCASKPSALLNMLRKRNPSPYMFIINLGEQEWLVGASPEMFVRVEETPQGTRVETCPISGTIKRGENALEDADRIREILINRKEESELTMCSDVDRNDKSRICRPGSVEVIGRRQIEKYSKLIHTVDHVEGYLREGFDALDAFLVHTWAVTVTGAPKPWAIQFVERNEKSPRCWYGGAVGLIGFDGGLNTGLTLRTIRLKDGVGEVRAGATLLFDSDPAAEEAETELKASAFRGAVKSANTAANGGSTPEPEREDSYWARAGAHKRVVLIDHQDSFVHTLANYLRQTGASVTTVRFGISREELAAMKPDLVVMSPGPGKPTDFDCSGTISMLIDMKIPVFGVCLGLQSMAEHFGAKLDVLSYPMHGKPSEIKLNNNTKWGTFRGLPPALNVARYHSLYADRASLDKVDDLVISAELEDGTVMAIEHATLPLAAVQFHPESLLTPARHGLTLLANALLNLRY
mmetsp:Transcript_22945/g.40642  ORF Transcript_22945/g.40642 Transcript_22945/m.40642 type:complete len:767 (-) Transcript_22945:120-2420(-)